MNCEPACALRCTLHLQIIRRRISVSSLIMMKVDTKLLKVKAAEENSVTCNTLINYKHIHVTLLDTKRLWRHTSPIRTTVVRIQRNIIILSNSLGQQEISTYMHMYIHVSLIHWEMDIRYITICMYVAANGLHWQLVIRKLNSMQRNSIHKGANQMTKWDANK